MVGEDNPNSNLTESEVVKIKEYLKEGKSEYEIADIIGCSRSTVNHISSGKKWGHI
jgi:DNA-binding NarL/FixJ family response regulator